MEWKGKNGGARPPKYFGLEPVLICSKRQLRPLQPPTTRSPTVTCNALVEREAARSRRRRQFSCRSNRPHPTNEAIIGERSINMNVRVSLTATKQSRVRQIWSSNNGKRQTERQPARAIKTRIYRQSSPAEMNQRTAIFSVHENTQSDSCLLRAVLLSCSKYAKSEALCQTG